MRYIRTVLFDERGAHLWVSRLSKGVDTSSIIGKLAWETVSPGKDMDFVKEQWAPLISGSVDFISYEISWQNPDNALSRFHYQCHVHRVAIDGPVKFCCTTKELPFSISKLSARELEILSLLGDGKSIKESAALLGISRSTVVSHTRRIQGKLEITSLSSLAVFAARYI